MPAKQPPVDPAVRLQTARRARGFLRTQALHTVAVLGVADIVGDEPVTVEELAAQVQANPSSLHRVLRLLASSGVFSEAAPGAFVSTSLSDGLRTDAPLSVRHMAMFQGSDTYVAAGQMRPLSSSPARGPARRSCREKSRMSHLLGPTRGISARR